MDKILYHGTSHYKSKYHYIVLGLFAKYIPGRSNHIDAKSYKSPVLPQRSPAQCFATFPMNLKRRRQHGMVKYITEQNYHKCFMVTQHVSSYWPPSNRQHILNIAFTLHLSASYPKLNVCFFLRVYELFMM